MDRIAPKRKNMLAGIDVSKWQGRIDWHTVATTTNVEFAIMRALYGTSIDRTYDDSWGFVENWDMCGRSRTSGLIRGCYQWLTAGSSGENQANVLCDLIEAQGGMHPDDLPPVIDVEDKTLPVLFTNPLKEVLDWCKVIEDRLKRVPIIYTAPYFWRDKITEDAIRYPLWIANTEVAAPLVPSSWPTWMLWQHSWKGKVSGITGDVDLNWFEGSKGDLVQLNKLLVPEYYDRIFSEVT